MSIPAESRRKFLKTISLAAGTCALSGKDTLAQTTIVTLLSEGSYPRNANDSADYTLHIRASPVEIAPKRIISATTYNGHFPGPLLRFKEGQQVTIDVYNHSDTAEQL